MNICVVGIGSNIDAEANIQKMLEILGRETRIVKVSSFLKTKPIGITGQPDFTNGAVKIETAMERMELKELLISIENQLGRDRSAGKWGPRTIDLDIVVWDSQIVDSDYYVRGFLKQTVDEVM